MYGNTKLEWAIRGARSPLTDSAASPHRLYRLAHIYTHFFSNLHRTMGTLTGKTGRRVDREMEAG
jgi:hypothetical protein